MIRIALAADLQPIISIYNQAVAKKFQTADTEPILVEDRQEWFKNHEDNQYPILVSEKDGQVTGWLSISPYRAGRKALSGCVEISYYVDDRFLHQGIGSALVTAALDKCRELGFHSVFAIILDRNTPSIKLMEKHGLSQWAHMPDIAEFDGERCGHVYYGRKL
jgi:phosphinothricin acetyltransferase